MRKYCTRNVNDKPTDKLVVLQRKCHANEQYSRRECLKMDCHCMPSKSSPKKVLLKLSWWKDSRQVLLNKKKLKQLKPESLNLPAGVKIYINGSLCPYYKKLWTKCRKLWDGKQILSFWVSNSKLMDP